MKKFPLSILMILFILMMCSVRITSIPGSDVIHFPYVDKVVHFGFFFILSGLLFIESKRQQIGSVSRFKRGVVIFLIAAVYGGGIELLQKYIFTYRSAEWLDFLADISGSLTALLILALIYPKRKVGTAG